MRRYHETKTLQNAIGIHETRNTRGKWVYIDAK